VGENLNICIVGWFWNEDFLNLVSRVQHKYPAVVIAHREPIFPPPIPYIMRENVGLEFGAYNYYLEEIWDGKSNVLFTHDDTRITKAGARKERIFLRIAAIKHDCAYLFRDLCEDEANGGKHGRAIFCSSRFLKYLKNNGSIWYDKENFGYSGAINVGVHTFHSNLGKIRRKTKLDVVNRVYFPDYECGRRGVWRHKEREWAKYG
jgi:hypothetical protein